MNLSTVFGAVRLAGMLLFAVLITSTARAAEVLDFRDAEFVMGQGDGPPPDSAQWEALSLPDLWNVSRPGVGGDGWYRLRFHLEQVPGQEYAVYLPRLCMNAAAYLNGTFLGDGGSFDEPVARNWNRPLFFLVPPSLLQAGENTLHLRVNSPVYSLGNLSAVQVGPENVLRPRYEEKFFLRITLNQTTTLIIAAMGLFMLALWVRRRRDTMYGLFGLSALVWAFNASNQFLQNIPMQAPLWEGLIQSSFQVFVALLMLSLLRFLDVRKRHLERLLWLMMIGSPLSMLLLPEVWMTRVSLVWHSITLISSLLVIAYLVRATFRARNFDNWLLTGTLAVNILFAAHDLMQQASILRNGDSHWLHFGGPLFFLVMGGIMTNRFVVVLNQFERLNADLENLVRAKHAELEAQFDSARNIEKQHAMMEERNRIYRDLHDDVGAKLLGLAISAQRANLHNEADLARSALQDLRDVVSRSAQAATPLSDLLADLRMETSQRVQAAGLQLNWRFPEQETAAMVSAEAALNLSRILRESVTNVLRHAHASRIDITTGIDGINFCFSVEDDGVGFPGAGLKPHRGMTGMQSRAASLGGTLDWQAVQPHGCRVEFCVPLASLPPD